MTKDTIRKIITNNRKEFAAHQLYAHIAELERKLKATTVERDALRTRAENAEAEVKSLRGRLSIAQHHATGRHGDYTRALEDRDALRKALDSSTDTIKWMVSQLEGDSGAGFSHWEQFPQFRDAIRMLGRGAELDEEDEA